MISLKNPAKRLNQLSRLFLIACIALLINISSTEAQDTWMNDTGSDVKIQAGYAPVNGLKMYYEIYGSGNPVVLLHGGLGSLEMFGPNISILAEKNKVIAVDLQGHGRTADIDRPIRYPQMADDVAELLKYLKIEKADIVGYSMGGGVALQVAIRHPEVVNRLVPASIPYKRSGFWPEILAQQNQMNEQSADYMKQTPMYEVYTKLAPKPEDWPKFVGKMGDYIQADYDYTDDIKKIKCPVLIVAADADIFPPSHAVELFNLLGGGLKDGGWDGSGVSTARLAIIPGFTHYNLFMSPKFGETVAAYLNSENN